MGEQHSATTRPQTSRLVIAACVGNLLEWYDFAVYALFSPFIAHAIFRPTDSFSQLAQSLLVFGLGAIARPFGAILIGLYADRRGRGPALLLTCLLMGAGTGLILVDPPYDTGGRFSIAILCIARLLQGVSAGGEIGGAAAFLAEQSNAGRSGFSAAFLQATMGLSNMLGAGVAATLTILLDHDAMARWGWRVPFCVGLAIVPIGLLLRRGGSMPQVDAAHPRANAAHIIKTLLTRSGGATACAFGLSVLWAAAPYALVIYLPLYFQSALQASAHDSYVAMLVGNIALVGGSLIAGRLADRFGPRRVLIGTALLLIFLPGVMLAHLAHLTHQPHARDIIAAAIALCGSVALFVGAAPIGIASLFPTSVRATGIAVPYNVAAAVFGGFAPALLAATGASWHGFPSPAIYVALATLPALSALSARPFGRLHRTGRAAVAMAGAAEGIAMADANDGTVTRNQKESPAS